MKQPTGRLYSFEGKGDQGLKAYLLAMLAVLLFAYTAFYKFMEHERFLQTLTAVFIFGGYTTLLSWFVPVLELVIVALILYPRTFRIGMWCFVSAMVMFTLYILAMLIWMDKLPCSCGGVIEKLSWPQHLIFNLAFIGLGLLALRLERLNHLN